MRGIASAVVLSFLCVAVGLAQTNPAPSFQPTPLEAFARQPATHIAWSKEVGRFDSSEAHAVVTALIRVVDADTRSSSGQRLAA